MTLLDFMRSSKHIETLTEIGMSGIIRIEAGSPALILDSTKYSRLSEIAKHYVQKFRDAPELVKLETYLWSKVLGDGPKIFRPTAQQLRFLEQIDLNIAIKDFASPFESIVVELPADYMNTKVIENPYFGRKLGQFEQAATQRPCLGVLHHKKGLLIHALIMESGTSLKSWMHGEDQLIEEWFEEGYPLPDSIMTTTDEEIALEAQVRRAVLNYCLLLDEIGSKVVGPVSPMHDQLIKWNKKKFNKHTLSNRLKLKGSPILYSLNREVKLHSTVDALAADNSESGADAKRLPPHHRRGHYRMQRYGPGLAESKRIRINPVFVNSHLLINGTITTTYSH